MRLTILFILVIFPAFCIAQNSGPDVVRSSAAYSEVLLRKTELQADLESLLPSYTEANPKIMDLRVELAALAGSVQKVLDTKVSGAGKLTLALGKLIVKKATLETDLARLSRSYSKDHPEVKRARRRVEIFEAAIAEVLR